MLPPQRPPLLGSLPPRPVWHIRRSAPRRSPAPEVVALLEKDRAGVEADMGRWQSDARSTVNHLERRKDAGTGFPEIEHHPVPQPLDGLASVLDGAAPSGT